MKEKLIPGLEDSHNTNPVIPLRQFVRAFLLREGKPRNFVNAVVGFTDGIFYTECRVGNPDYHAALALKTARKLGISDVDLAGEVRNTAESLYQTYKQLANIETEIASDTFTTPDTRKVAIEVMDWKLQFKMRQEEEEKKRKKAECLKFMRNRFAKLMEMSDTEISIHNANLRINLRNDPVYETSCRDVREVISKRSLKESFYEQALKKISKSDDSISLNIKTDVDRKELLHYAQYVQRDAPLQVEIGEDNFVKFVTYIFALLRGESISASEVKSWGLDPKVVLKKARGIVNHYCVDRADRERASCHRVVKKKIRKKGFDPHVFLGDGSGRNYLGYIQGQPKEKD